MLQGCPCTRPDSVPYKVAWSTGVLAHEVNWLSLSRLASEQTTEVKRVEFVGNHTWPGPYFYRSHLGPLLALIFRYFTCIASTRFLRPLYTSTRPPPFLHSPLGPLSIPPWEQVNQVPMQKRERVSVCFLFFHSFLLLLYSLHVRGNEDSPLPPSREKKKKCCTLMPSVLGLEGMHPSLITPPADVSGEEKKKVPSVMGFVHASL